jgi:hypothetical protein
VSLSHQETLPTSIRFLHMALLDIFVFLELKIVLQEILGVLYTVGGNPLEEGNNL